MMENDLNNGFEELVRKKLEDYKIPVEQGNWDVIEQSLIRKKRTKYFHIAAGAVAAAIVLFLITVLPENNDNNMPQNNIQTNAIPEKSTSSPTIQPNVAEQITEKTATEQNQHVSKSVPKYNAAINTPRNQSEKSKSQPENPPIKEKLRIIPQKTVSGISINLSIQNKFQLPDNTRLVEPTNKKTDDKMNDRNSPDNNKLAPLNKNKSTDKGWSVSMGFGAGGYQNIDGNKQNSNLIAAAPLLTSSNSTDYIKNKHKDEIMVPDNADSQYGLPLSGKLIVRKNFNNKWAVESGLNYTYLPTKYKWNKNTVGQQLHYLGIPLNVVYYVVSKPKWNIYASAGGMMEKGVYSHLDRSDNSTTKVNMKGLQWSVNGSAGITYNLYRGLGLFFEPQFGYFFDNGQPESIRTAWPVSFSIGAGVRFDF
jgi:hypothetical protein